MENKEKKVGDSASMSEQIQVGDSASMSEQIQEGKTAMGSDKLQIDKHDVQKKGKTTMLEPVVERHYDPVKNVTRKKETWRLGVVLDDMWTVYKGDNEDHVQLLIRDIKGDTIQITIMQDDIAAWKPKLCEGKTYYMRNFKVLDNDSDFKMSPHKCRLIFVAATRVDEVQIPTIPKTLFNFKDFADIQQGKYIPNLLVDAIGVINEIRKVVTATQTRKGNVEFILKDLRDNTIDCTLWDALSVEFINKYNQICDLGPVVLIIKHVKIKEPKGVYPLQLTNVWNGTKLLFDATIPDISTFLKSLPKDVTYCSQNSQSINTTQFYTQTSGGSQFNSDETFMKQARIVSLGDMKKLKVDTYCVTAVTTDHILVSKHGWYFLSCPQCACKTEGSEPPYKCKKGHPTNEPIIKYKLDVEVADGDTRAKFVFWDTTLDELTGMTAAMLLEQQKQIGLADPQEYPQALEDLMDRKFAFRVKWQPGWGGQASVVQCKDSKELITKIHEHLPVAESETKDVLTIEPIDEEAVNNFESPQIQKFTQADIDKFSILDDSILSTPNFSGTADTEGAASSHKTPAKRGANKQPPVESTNLESQFSSTRSGKLIKKEKIR